MSGRRQTRRQVLQKQHGTRKDEYGILWDVKMALALRVWQREANISLQSAQVYKNSGQALVESCLQIRVRTFPDEEKLVHQRGWETRAAHERSANGFNVRIFPQQCGFEHSHQTASGGDFWSF